MAIQFIKRASGSIPDETPESLTFPTVAATGISDWYQLPPGAKNIQVVIAGVATVVIEISNDATNADPLMTSTSSESRDTATKAMFFRQNVTWTSGNVDTIIAF